MENAETLHRTLPIAFLVFFYVLHYPVSVFRLCKMR